MGGKAQLNTFLRGLREVRVEKSSLISFEGRNVFADDLEVGDIEVGLELIISEGGRQEILFMYNPLSTSICTLGARAFSSSTPFFEDARRIMEPGVLSRVDEVVVNPLRVVRLDERTTSLHLEMDFVVRKETEGHNPTREMEDVVMDGENLFNESWLVGKFTRFSQFLGMPTKGFEVDIVGLLKKMKGMRGKNWEKKIGPLFLFDH